MDAINCETADPSWRVHCRVIKDELADGLSDIDDIQTQVYIISGVCGGVALILVVILIALAIQLSSLRQQVLHLTGKSSGKPKATPERSVATKTNGESTHLRHQPQPPHSYVQPPKNMTSEEELAQLGFSAYTGHPVDQRGLSTSPAVNSAGGVRVLPRNPPAGFRNTGAFNEGYM